MTYIVNNRYGLTREFSNKRAAIAYCRAERRDGWVLSVVRDMASNARVYPI